MKTFIVTYFGAMLIALVLTPLLAMFARRMGLLDQPNHRKVHSIPTPRIGGLAILVAAFSLLLPVISLDNLVGESFRVVHARVWVLLLSSILVFIVGLIDDIRGLASRIKLLVIVMGALSICASGTMIHTLSLGASHSIQLGWFALPLTVLWIVGVTVGINFIDGLDGLAAGIAAITCGVIAAVAASGGQMVTAVIALSLLGALTGFLVFNFHPARIFMGDGGSMFVGFLLAGASLMAVTNKAQSFLGLAVPAMTLGVPILDAAVAILRRGVMQRGSLFRAERGHIHHRLVDMGFKQRQAVMLLYGVTLLSAILAFATYRMHEQSVPLLLVLLLLPLALFRLTGSLRLRQTLSAFRRNYRIGQAAGKCRSVFEEVRAKLSVARNFTQWWEGICNAAESLGLVSISMTLKNRDGSIKAMTWSLDNTEPNPAETVSASVPVQQRRAGDLLHCQIRVTAADSLELAGQRIAYFSRLLGESSVARLPFDLRSCRGVESAGTDTPELPARRSTPRRSFMRLGRRSTLPLPKIAGEDETDPSLSIEHRPRRIAIVHDFLYTYAGAERVLEQILNVYPEADLFSLFDFLPENKRGFIRNKPVKTSFIQKMPMASKKHRAYLPLMPLAIEQLDVSKYDLVLSSSYLAAKGVITRGDQLHVCYCHTPVRFAWDLQQQYLSESGLLSGLRSLLARSILHYIRAWDLHSAGGVDAFMTNSDYVGRRISKTYRRESQTVYPPVDVDTYTVREEKEDFYLTMSRLVPYKRVDLVVEAFNELPGRRLMVIGEGPEMAKIRAKAGPNIILLGFQPQDQVREYMQRAKAFVFAAEEDFGIVPVEAQACGTPVIAYAKGGVTESVIDGRTGVFFQQQTAEAIRNAVKKFEANEVGWDPFTIRANAERFSSQRFRERFQAMVENEWLSFSLGRGNRRVQNHDAAQEETADSMLTSHRGIPVHNTDVA